MDSPALPSPVIATLHPAAVLRAEDPDPAYRGLLADVRTAATVLGRRG